MQNKKFRVFCKESCRNAYSKGNTYIAYREDASYIWVIIGPDEFIGSRFFSNQKYRGSLNMENFKDYFLTEQELRKEKIKKLSK